MRERKSVHFYYKCSSVKGTVYLQQSYMYKSNRSLGLLCNGCVTDVKYSKSHNTAGLAKVILGERLEFLEY